jgi:hypothetical protein
VRSGGSRDASDIRRAIRRLVVVGPPSKAPAITPETNDSPSMAQGCRSTWYGMSNVRLTVSLALSIVSLTLLMVSWTVSLAVVRVSSTASLAFSTVSRALCTVPLTSASRVSSFSVR